MFHFRFKHLYLMLKPLDCRAKDSGDFVQSAKGPSDRLFEVRKGCAAWVRPSRWPSEFQGEWLFRKKRTRVRDVAIDMNFDCLRGVLASFLTSVASLPYFQDANISLHAFMMAMVKEHFCSTGHSETLFFHWLRRFRSQRCRRVRCQRCLWARWWDSAKSVKKGETKKGYVTCFWWTPSRTAALLELNWSTTWFCLPYPSYPIQEWHIDLSLIRKPEFLLLMASSPYFDISMKIARKGHGCLWGFPDRSFLQQ